MGHNSTVKYVLIDRRAVNVFVRQLLQQCQSHQPLLYQILHSCHDAVVSHHSILQWNDGIQPGPCETEAQQFQMCFFFGVVVSSNSLIILESDLTTDMKIPRLKKSLPCHTSLLGIPAHIYCPCTPQTLPGGENDPQKLRWFHRLLWDVGALKKNTFPKM